ncbi:8-oxo-dGTP pyrophosphatase MutT (NUDIX family) [Catenuloplanes nepalensis]|uniref:8-oxo-dGTP pyrophosphatase MutT (NUDIX family) n=1 Tax=Catenuloplanes nepalensis TaxID=587533 RepID=A0ABT9N4S0_9ACTN|nr:NUDIX domain-containing protein [Catenuloplanes nepalensis]MDP9798703.1 8-oxo-dGTP pyrophosphatase MutT (NUDIX family) [Catenuloplanes nepalensis]
MPYTIPLDVFLILSRGEDVLLALRQGTGFADGLWNVPSGKVEPGESAVAAVLREAREEAGLSLTAADVRLATTVHLSRPGGHARLGLFFHATHAPARHGDPVNAEPHKCGGLAWFPAVALPPDTEPYNAAGLTGWRTGTPLILDGWPA